MKITIVYGGRGLIEDPALFVLERTQAVLEELRVDVERINLYEEKNQISTVPSRLRDSDGVILAVSLEWYGIGGLMQEFLDACWLYGDRDHIRDMYMFPMVIAQAGGEKEAMLHLTKAWEILGGKIGDASICAYVSDPVEFEISKEYSSMIEKKAEQIYRVINQRIASFPSSGQAVSSKAARTAVMDLTPQESDQLSRYVADDNYVKQQKEDIEELANMFKGRLRKEEQEEKRRERASGSAPASRHDSASEGQSAAAPESAGNAGRGADRDIRSDSGDIRSGSGEGTSDQLRRASRKRAVGAVIPGDFSEKFRGSFHPQSGFKAVFLIHLTDRDQMLRLEVNERSLSMTTTDKEEGDVIIRTTSSVINSITIGEMTFQRAFMGGDMKVMGDFKTLRVMDQIFRFARRY